MNPWNSIRACEMVFSLLPKGGLTLLRTDTQNIDESEQTLNTKNEIAVIQPVTRRRFLMAY